MISVASTQFNFCYDKEIRVPYAVASLISYCQTIPEIQNNFQFEPVFLHRQKLEEYVQKAIQSDILLCSCYCWNWEINSELARRVKEKHPSCLVVFGGPQVSIRDELFFDKYPFVDVAVFGEGEYALSKILCNYFHAWGNDGIPGIATRTYRNTIGNRVELDDIPSPYLNGLIENLTESSGDVDYIVSWETNRGCPYSCAFCDWGGCMSSKIRKRSLETLQKEIEWFAEKKINYIDCCDANFGILHERDKKIALMLNQTNQRTGYPKRIRPAWTKNISPKTIEIASILKEVDMLKGVTTDLQSLNETVLENISRKNATLQKYKEVTKLFSEENIPTYTELIVGLPGETLESWKSGLRILMEETDLSSLYVYNCNLFPNAPMGDPLYQKKYQIKTIPSPIYLTHSSRTNKQEPQEYEQILVESYSYSTADLTQMFYFAWQSQVFYSLGLLEYVVKYLSVEKKVNVIEFFEALDKHFAKSDFLSEEIKDVKKYIERGYSGLGWDHTDDKLGSIFWSIEEASWLRLVNRIDEFAELVIEFLFENFGVERLLAEDLMRFQIFMLTTPRFAGKFKAAILDYNWKIFFEGQPLEKSFTYCTVANLVPFVDDWLYKVMWFGRAQRKYKSYLNQVGAEKA